MDPVNNFTSLFENAQYEALIDKITDTYSESIYVPPNVSYILAASYFKLNNYIKSEEVCQSIYSVYQQDPDFAALYGATLRRLARYQEALDILEPFVSSNSSNPTLINNYCNLLIDLQRYDEAKSMLLDLRASNPPNIKDVLANLKRLDASQSSTAIASIEKTPLKASALSSNRNIFDPLDVAFGIAHKNFGIDPSLVKESEEVVASRLTKLLAENSNVSLSEQISLLRSLASHNKKAAVEFALKITENRTELNQELLEIISDCYLDSQEFSKAYLMFSVLYQISEESRFAVNLFSLSALLGERLPSIYWLNVCSGLDIDKEVMNSLNQTFKTKFS